MEEHTSKYRLTSDQLYHACDRSQFAFETTAELEMISTAVGQERALDAIAFGIDMPHDGFNLYVMGSPGLGRHTFVREALEERAGLQRQQRPSELSGTPGLAVAGARLAGEIAHGSRSIPVLERI